MGGKKKKAGGKKGKGDDDEMNVGTLNAILEAQIAGLPFVAFDTGGNKEIIINDYTGFIVPFLDVESLILKSCYLLNDYKKREVFQNNAVNSYTERFADNLILSNYDTVLTEINNL